MRSVITPYWLVLLVEWPLLPSEWIISTPLSFRYSYSCLMRNPSATTCNFICSIPPDQTKWQETQMSSKQVTITVTQSIHVVDRNKKVKKSLTTYEVMMPADARKRVSTQKNLGAGDSGWSQRGDALRWCGRSRWLKTREGPPRL